MHTHLPPARSDQQQELATLVGELTPPLPNMGFFDAPQNKAPCMCKNTG
jgi:hypothetical protein